MDRVLFFCDFNKYNQICHWILQVSKIESIAVTLVSDGPICRKMLALPVINSKIGVMLTNVTGFWFADSNLSQPIECLAKRKIVYINNLPHLYWKYKDNKEHFESKLNRLYLDDDIELIFSCDELTGGLGSNVVPDYDLEKWERTLSHETI